MKIDGRQLDHALLETYRIEAVDCICEKGGDPEAVASKLGLHLSTIYKWVSLFRNNGKRALASKTAKGPEPKLPLRSWQKIKKQLSGHSPSDYGLAATLWTPHLVQELILKEWDIRLGLRTINRWLTSLAIRPRRRLRDIITGHPDLERELKRSYKNDSWFYLEFIVSNGSDQNENHSVPIRQSGVERSGFSATAKNGGFWYINCSGRNEQQVFIEFSMGLMSNRPENTVIIVEANLSLKPFPARGFSCWKEKVTSKYDLFYFSRTF